MSEDELAIPANIDCERILLGCLILDASKHAECLKYITADDFSLDSHQLIFIRIGHMVQEGITVDTVTLAEYLMRNGYAKSSGAITYLCSLLEGLPDNLPVKDYGLIIKEKSLLRQIMLKCEDALLRCSRQDEPAIDVGRDVVKELTVLFKGKK